ncbi:MAG: FAA hydrolase family protein, partial [Planctomycetota bacterium]
MFMAIPLVRFSLEGQKKWGILENNEIYPLSLKNGNLSTLLEISVSMLQNLCESSSLPWESAEIVCPLDTPCQIICQGKNYLEHLQETGFRKEEKDFNLLFSKASSSLTGPYGPVIRPKEVQLLDYEIELGVVIGKGLTKPRSFQRDQLLEAVYGLVIANDISARDIQLPQRQWFKGKSYPTFCPVGPWILALEEEDLPKISSLTLELSVNGELRQKAQTSQMIYSIEETLEEISHIFHLYPGDLLLTGTPGGVALQISEEWKKKVRGLVEKEKWKDFIQNQLQSGRYLKPGDIVEAKIFEEESEEAVPDERQVQKGLDLG